MKRKTVQKLGFNVLGVFCALVWVFPVYWMLRNAFSKTPNSTSAPSLLPDTITLDNFKTIFADERFWSAFVGSMTVTAITVVIALVAAFFAALAVTRFKFAGRNSMVIMVLVIQMIPAEALFLSQFRMLDGWGMLNNFIGLSVLYVGIALPITWWVLRGFVASIPEDIEEAAMIDGCSKFGAFMRVTFPLLAPGLVISGIFCFLAAWNEYVLALVVMTRNGTATLPLWLKTFSGVNQATDWGAIMAGSLTVAVPVIVVFLIVQNKMATGMSAGAVKG